MLVGDAAPEHLGPATFDLYLEWGTAYRPLLERHRDLYAVALTRTPENARKHILLGLVWKVSGYEAETILAILAGVAPTNVSEAAQWLGFSAAEAHEMPLDAALQFWEASLGAALPAEAYEGFGWFAMIERLDADHWLDLTLRSAQAAGGQLAQAAKVAQRALQLAHDERAIRIVTALLGANLKLWYLEGVGEVGLQMLTRREEETAPARRALREKLLEREFFEARDRDEAEPER
jgi:hypothetical protein